MGGSVATPHGSDKNATISLGMRLDSLLQLPTGQIKMQQIITENPGAVILLVATPHGSDKNATHGKRFGLVTEFKSCNSPRVR